MIAFSTTFACERMMVWARPAVLRLQLAIYTLPLLLHTYTLLIHVFHVLRYALHLLFFSFRGLVEGMFS